jgi:hypothetical protein
MDASIISGISALAGAAIGGLTSAVAAWFSQRETAQSQWHATVTLRRQDIYRDFIEVAAKCHLDALQHGNPDIAGLVGLYANISRMRVLSSHEVVERAEEIAQKILDTYPEPDITFADLRKMAKGHALDLLYEFGKACRRESEARMKG